MARKSSWSAMCVVGARPNLVKMAPILRAMTADGRLRPLLVHTGQHYDAMMSDIFFRELNIPRAPVNLAAGSGTHAEQTGRVMAGLETLVRERRPDIVVTVGDVNSTLAAALVAAKAPVPLAHVEAGLRSRDPLMPEEVNRVVVDRLSDLLFTHSDEADANLLNEGLSAGRIHRVGNVMIDTLLRLRPERQGAAASALGNVPDEFGVVTMHRPGNVDDPGTLTNVMNTLAAVARRLPLIFPVHPRTRAQLGHGQWPGIRMIEPLGYLPFLDLVEHARVVITDSGGIQEETTVLGVPCLTMRDSTERPVTVRLGTNRLIGADPAAILPAVDAILRGTQPHSTVPPLWDGHAAERTVSVIAEWLGEPHPPRLTDCAH